jgi:hypothetical protein
MNMGATSAEEEPEEPLAEQSCKPCVAAYVCCGRQMPLCQR